MTSYERLLAEELPTGTFGDAKPTTRPAHAHIQRTSPADAARHLAELADAISAPRPPTTAQLDTAA